MRSLNPSGHEVGRGRWSELFPTPHMMAEESTSLYGVSQVMSSQRTTPKDQMSTFSEHGSFRMISGAIQATVPAKLIRVLISFHCRHVPKSLIFATSFEPMRTLEG
jgi:hypothetical protein